jgi:hypothetical protein
MNWFCLYITVAGEFRALSDLQDRQLNAYLPLATRIRTTRGQRREYIEPLMRRYLFVCVDDINSLAKVRSLATVQGVLPHEREPLIVPAYQVNNLKQRQSYGEFRVSDSPAGKRKLRMAKLRSFKELALYMDCDKC